MKNPRLIDMGGRVVGDWTVISQAGNSLGGGALWTCLCACGNTSAVLGSDLRNGSSKRCRACCVNTWKMSSVTHGDSRSRLHNIWKLMRARCADTSDPVYGGRGISVCPEWQSYEAFREWALANGYAEVLSIDRIDNDLGYHPDNCRWATEQQQSVNRRFILRNDAGVAWCDISKANGIPVTLMHGRIHAGWPVEKAATLPKGSRVSR